MSVDNLRSQTNWFVMFLVSALIGVGIGYFITLVYRPQLIPPSLRIGGLTKPQSILLLGVDVVYSGDRRHSKADLTSFQGRSDTIMLARFDPKANAFSVLSIPRDTNVEVPGYGHQKINGANALGGESLAMRTVQALTGVPIEHYVVLNVHGLVELVDALGGITVQIPKKMKYRDRTAKLNINLNPGPYTLNGSEAMGFVRFRHDALGDIGRVQRQEIFIRAVMDKAMSPASWAKVPELLKLAQKHVKTDLSVPEIMQVLTFVRSVPKANQHMIMLPGNFSGTGDWAVDEDGLRVVVAQMMGHPLPAAAREKIKVSIENASSQTGLQRKLSRYLSSLGYMIMTVSGKSELFAGPLGESKIIAERGNSSEAALLKHDLRNKGEIVNASIGDIQSSLTLVLGDDMIPLVEALGTGAKK
ncbi:MAG: LCP family protein [Candidatus Obscuribacterales bacterium]|nr:LCP family protein [Candidatus Obscuribacterales bacterium]